MNLILLFKEDFIGNTRHVRLQGRRHHHVKNILRVSEGDRLCVGLCNDKIGQGLITSLNDRMLEMDVEFSQDPPLPLSVTLIIALPRPPVLRRVLLTAGSMGVKEIIIFNTKKVEKTFWQSHALIRDNIDQQLILGLEQARDTMMPKVLLRPRFKPFVEDQLPSLIQGARPVMADPQSGTPFPMSIEKKAVVLIGPEGGLIPYERQKIIDVGFDAFHLGKRILRVEVAVPALLSRFLV